MSYPCKLVLYSTMVLAGAILFIKAYAPFALKNSIFGDMLKMAYFKASWLCVMVSYLLFCFPCIIFGGDKLWSEAGLTDIAHFTENRFYSRL